MPRMFATVALLLLLLCKAYAQYPSGLWKGTGEYLPGSPFAQLMHQLAAEKKLVFEIGASGKVSGKLITQYAAHAAMPHEGGNQQFTLNGRYDEQAKRLLLVITHFRSRPDSSESYLTFAKPDSVYYNLSSHTHGSDLVITGTADTAYNSNATTEWIGTFKGGGLSMYPGNNSMHILPLRIRFDLPGKGLSSPTVASASYSDTPAAPKARVVATTRYPSVRTQKIQRTITIDTSLIKLQVYDNGEIDGDIATLLFDGKIILSKQLLSARAAELTLNVSTQTQEHILELYANNLGSIPPNTALVVLTCRNRRYEIHLSSDETTNGAVKLVFKK